MKGFIITLLLCFLSWNVSIADNSRFLVVNAKDGTKTTFALVNEPKVYFNNGMLSVISKSATFSLNLADILSYTFSEELTRIDEAVENKNVNIENGYVFFSGLKAGSNVSIYASDGRLLNVFSSNSNGSAIVDLSVVPKGIIILKSNKTNIKIINR